ncbi:MAG TPA: BON domain-containing protein [Terriglobia bacterium]|nr:BON domain-containing protein [Terriglobia bacterium]
MTKEEVYKPKLYQRTFSIGSCLALISLLFLFAPVSGRADVGPSNAEITAGVQSRLYNSGIFKHGEVNVQVTNGVATLTGTVDSYGQELRAIRAARHQEGVNSVVNKVQVSAEDVSPQQILAKARHQVLLYPYYTIFDNITLSTQGNQLTVSGQVTQPYKKSDLGNILADIRGVTNLKNDIQVLPLSSYDNHIRLAIARRIYGDPGFFNYGNQANPSIHIVVDNGNVVLEGVVNSNIDRQRAEFDARFAATYFGLKNNLRVES